MAIRWDRLQPVMTAPYMPTLAPHPQAVTPGLFADVIAMSGVPALEIAGLSSGQGFEGCAGRVR
jgi:hypothetical protein